jgi:CO/xanthine dehydrogenase FAD-binding subunit
VRTLVADAAGFDAGEAVFALVAVPMQTIQLLDDRQGFFASARRAIARDGLVALAITETLERFEDEVELPPPDAGMRSRYRKVRDRASYAFAITAVAGALRVEDGRVADIRIALGGVSTKPWRARRAEALLHGAEATEESFRRAAAAEFEDAVGRGANAFKIELGQRTIVAVLRDLDGKESQQ